MVQFTQQVLYGENLDRNHPPASSEDAKVRFISTQGEAFGMNERQLSTHTLLVGSTGCGKTSVVCTMLDQLLPSLGSDDLFILFDADGGYAKRYYDPRNPRHILMSLSPSDVQRTYVWNIFGEMRDAGGRLAPDYAVTAHELASAMMYGRENRQQPFFSDAAQHLISDQLIALAEDDGKHTEDFLSVMRSNQQANWLTLTQRKEFRAHQLYFGRGEKLTSQALGVFGEMNAALQETFGSFPNGNGRGECSMRQLVREKGGKVIFLEYDIALGESQKPLLRLWFDLGIKFALGSRSSGQVYFVCDELALLPDLRHLSDALNFGRSKGVRMVCALQSINQFHDAYGEKADSILAGFCSCFAFRCYDSASRDYIAKRFGKHYVLLTTRSAGGELTHLPREGSVAEDWDIRALHTGEALIDLAGDVTHLFRFQFRPHL